MHAQHGRLFPRVVYTVAQINVHYVLITMVVDHPHSGRAPRAAVEQFNPHYYMLTAMEVDDHRYTIYPHGRI